MPRVARQALGGYVYHVSNRAVGRMTLFQRDADYNAFERVLAQTQQQQDMPLLGWCVMPNHWHLVVQPRRDGDLGRFMQRLTTAHPRRWQAHHHHVGEGHIYQGRYKSFPVEDDAHLLTVLRYVERNPLRANLVGRAEDWPWSSLWMWVHRRRAMDDAPVLSDLPVDRPRNWVWRVNQPQPDEQLEAVRLSVQRGRPLGSPRWVASATRRMGLESTFRPRGRPRKTAD